MAEYIRFVSYVFAYQDEKRGRNVGYVKFESRLGIKRIAVLLSGVRMADPLDVYLMYREKETYVGIFIGSILIRNQRGELQYSTVQERFGDEECTVQELCGIVLLPKAYEGAYLCTLWDDLPFSMEHFVSSRKELPQVENGYEAAGFEDVLEKDSISFLSPVEIIDTENAIKESMVEETEKPLPEQPLEAEVPKSDAAEAETEEPKEVESEEEMPSENREDIRWEPQKKYWNRLCKLYPKVRPFPYETNICCLRVKPGDIGRLPREYWHLASNSFLLHAYYQYRYLLLIRQGDEEKTKAFLGIPGVFTENERSMAEMFGFSEFKSSPKEKISDQGFGYWLAELIIEKE